MKSELHYSPTALVLRSGWMLLATAVVLADYIAHANGGFPRMFGLGFASSAALMATALYFVGATMFLTLGLIRHGGVALAATENGIAFNSAWSAKTFAWADISTIALDMRYTKSSRYTIVAIHETTGVVRCHTVDTRLLSETLDQVGDWVEGAELQRVARGGATYVAPTSGLAGYNARVHARDLAADLAAARGSIGRSPWKLG